MNPAHPPIVALITDFGLQDEYVGVMKGVILSVNPEARIVDVCHTIEPHGIVQAGRMLVSVTPYFPPETVFVVVVDPGVGGERDILAVRREGIVLLAPDNGLLSVWRDDWLSVEIVRVQQARYFLSRVSRTFHGRDIFAPVAGHLTRGIALKELGPAVAPGGIQRVSVPKIRIEGEGEVRGTVIAVDRFGNLITDIHSEVLSELERMQPKRDWRIEVRQTRLYGLCSFYGEVDLGQPLALIGSRGTLEIAVNGGSAAVHLDAEAGTPVLVRTAR
jgi:S-adenosylmethionine hydrolase